MPKTMAAAADPITDSGEEHQSHNCCCNPNSSSRPTTLLLLLLWSSTNAFRYYNNNNNNNENLFLLNASCPRSSDDEVGNNDVSSEKFFNNKRRRPRETNVSRTQHSKSCHSCCCCCCYNILSPQTNSVKASITETWKNNNALLQVQNHSIRLYLTKIPKPIIIFSYTKKFPWFNAAGKISGIMHAHSQITYVKRRDFTMILPLLKERKKERKQQLFAIAKEETRARTTRMKTKGAWWRRRTRTRRRLARCLWRAPKIAAPLIPVSERRREPPTRSLSPTYRQRELFAHLNRW